MSAWRFCGALLRTFSYSVAASAHVWRSRESNPARRSRVSTSSSLLIKSDRASANASPRRSGSCQTTSIHFLVHPISCGSQMRTLSAACPASAYRPDENATQTNPSIAFRFLGSCVITSSKTASALSNLPSLRSRYPSLRAEFTSKRARSPCASTEHTESKTRQQAPITSLVKDRRAIVGWATDGTLGEDYFNLANDFALH
jgi:hypothetical protein